MNFFSLFEKPKNSVAFSFDHETIRYVSLTRAREGISVVNHGSELLGAEIISPNGLIVNDTLLIDRLRKIKNRIDFGNDKNHAVMVVPDHLALMFHTHIAKESGQQMNDVIINHIKTYCAANLSLPFSDYICEYDIILETSWGYDAHVTLVPKLIVNHFTRIFKQADIVITHIETAHHAVARACLEIPTGNGAVLVSVGKKQSTVAVLHGDHCVSQRVVKVGEETIATTIQNYLHTDRAYADKIIARHGMLQTHPDVGLLGELYLAIDPICRSIDEQLIAIGQIPYKTFGERFITENIFVYGSGTHIQGLIPLIGEKTGLAARELDIWAGYRHERAPLLDMHAKEILTYAEPLALALVYLK